MPKAALSERSALKAGGDAIYKALEARWERVTAFQREAYAPTLEKWLTQLKKNSPEGYNRWLAEGRPIKAGREARASETLTTQGAWYAATGDVAFREAILAAKKYGFDHQNSTTLKRHRDVGRGFDAQVFITCITRLRRHGASLRSAAAQTAVAYSIPCGGTFDSLVKKLARLYRSTKSGE